MDMPRLFAGPSVLAWHMFLAGAEAGEGELILMGGTKETKHSCCAPPAGAEQWRPCQALATDVRWFARHTWEPARRERVGCAEKPCSINRIETALGWLAEKSTPRKCFLL